jgi:hypothetical protein
MKESILSKIAICRYCGTAYIPEVEGDFEACDPCIDSVEEPPILNEFNEEDDDQ